jgi:hypothetical protein
MSVVSAKKTIGIQTIKIVMVAANRKPVAAIPKGQMRTPNGLARETGARSVSISVDAGNARLPWRLKIRMLIRFPVKLHFLNGPKTREFHSWNADGSFFALGDRFLFNVE